MSLTPANHRDRTGPNAAGMLRGGVWERILVIALLGVHAGLLAYGAAIHTPARDEVGHLPAGISHWQFGRFELYRVNPPLVRMIAALPVLAAQPNYDWRSYVAGRFDRPEFAVGTDFIVANGPKSLAYFTIARWVCIPFSLLGGFICYRWARRLYGTGAGFAALALWCFLPDVIANGQMVTPDMAAASVGVLTYYLFTRWLEQPRVERMGVVAVLLGVLQLTKTTWLLFYPVLFGVWLVARAARAASAPVASRRLAGEFGQLLMMVVTSLSILNAGYFFEKVGVRLGDMEFVSATLGGGPTGDLGNRFRGTLLENVPMPLPQDYVYGLDFIKFEFETKYMSFLRGEWRRGGWWYYYLYGLAVKSPTGVIALALLAALTWLAARGQWPMRRKEIGLLVPAAYILVLTSSQTGFNHHLRYALPAVPYLIVFCSRIFADNSARSWKTLGWGLVASAVVGSLTVYPHSQSYFNLIAGGPENGPRHLLDSNVDWGQDLMLLRDWLDERPEVNPLYLATFANFPPSIVGIHAPPPPPCAEWPQWKEGYGERNVAKPGWYVFSVNELYDSDGRYRQFQELEPVARVGYSTYIFHINEQQIEWLYGPVQPCGADRMMWTGGQAANGPLRETDECESEDAAQRHPQEEARHADKKAE